MGFTLLFECQGRRKPQKADKSLVPRFLCTYIKNRWDKSKSNFNLSAFWADIKQKNMKRTKLLMTVLLIVALAGYGTAKSQRGQKTQRPTTTIISINSNPEGAKVIVNGKTLDTSTPCTVAIPLHIHNGVIVKTDAEKQEFAKNIQTKIIFIKDGYVQGEEIHQPIVTWQRSMGKQIATNITYPDGVFHSFKRQSNESKAYADDPTIRAGEAKTVVSRDNPGGTALERTIVRWYFDSSPRGARIFWRVISSVPDMVKNTNELYMTSTPYEETRSFNILGLTYENSRDVTIEIKVSSPGYHDQVKRYNVRQAIDQQEISGFFDLVKIVQQ